VNDPVAETVRLIFRMYSEGMCIVSLAEYLNARGILTPNISKAWKNAGAGLWQAGHISIILRSPAYIGEYLTMRRSTKGKEGTVMQIPAIVRADQFERAGKALAEKGAAARGSRGRHYLLRGIIYCGHCGLAMVGSTGGNSKPYYRCTGTVNRGAGKKCGSRQVQAGEIESMIWSDIKKFIRSPGEETELIREGLNRPKSELRPPSDELYPVEKAIFVKKDARSKIISMIARGFIKQEEAEKELQILASEIDLLSRRRELLLRLGEKSSLPGVFEGFAGLLEKLAQRVDALPPSGEVVRLLVKRVEVSTGEQNGKPVSRVSVYYRFSGGEKK
ncbi:MAG: recombinase family protein, partial [Desulfocucumaceae bacterium]